MWFYAVRGSFVLVVGSRKRLGGGFVFYRTFSKFSSFECWRFFYRRYSRKLK